MQIIYVDTEIFKYYVRDGACGFCKPIGKRNQETQLSRSSILTLNCLDRGIFLKNKKKHILLPFQSAHRTSFYLISIAGQYALYRTYMLPDLASRKLLVQ